TDLFSVGVILYEMVSGKRMGRVPPTAVAGVPRHVESAILRCLEMDPARRFASAPALSAALSNSRLYRPVPSYTFILLVSLAFVFVIGAGILAWQTKRSAIVAVQPAPAAPKPPVQDLPTVAI